MKGYSRLRPYKKENPGG